MKIVSWNVNGIRACERGGFVDWFKTEEADVVCLQEVKAFVEQLGEEVRHPLGYRSVFHSAKKPGYSGVALYSRREPLAVTTGIGIEAIDNEGRVLAAEFPGDLVVVSAYFPNSQREHQRLGFKLEFCAAMREYCDRLRAKGKHLVLCGDYNIAHTEIDLKNPKSNQKNAGFLPEERAWMTSFLQAGYVDTFRELHPGETGHYTWWSYRPGVREKNVGWRIDYHCVNPELRDRIQDASILPEVYGSDHCPIRLTLKD